MSTLMTSDGSCSFWSSLSPQASMRTTVARFVVERALSLSNATMEDSEHGRVESDGFYALSYGGFTAC